MGVDRDETLRIVGKILASAESSHALEYKYDEDGSLAGKKDSHGLTRYHYLDNGQLCGVLLPDGRQIEYRFDENGFRAEKLIDGKLAQRYQWDDLITLSAVEDRSGVTRIRYGENGNAIGMVRNGQKLLLATDQLGCIFTVADLSGDSVQEVLYDSFGREIQNSSPELALPLGFAGGLHDADTGLIHFGYREYDPATGRFISPDPLGYAGGDVDLYGYCQNEPVNGTDPFGLFRFGKRTLGALKSLDTKTAKKIKDAAKNTTQGRIISAVSDAVGDNEIKYSGRGNSPPILRDEHEKNNIPSTVCQCTNHI